MNTNEVSRWAMRSNALSTLVQRMAAAIGVRVPWRRRAARKSDAAWTGTWYGLTLTSSTHPEFDTWTFMTANTGTDALPRQKETP